MTEKKTALKLGVAAGVILVAVVILGVLTRHPAQEEPAAPQPSQEAAAAETVAPMETAEPEPGTQLPPPPELDINGWEFLYAGLNNGVGRYHPEVGVIEGQYLDKRVVDAASAFLAAARAEGYTVYIGVGYRNFEYNLFYYDNAIAKYGSAYEAAKHIFPPGTSEHSTGLAFDITDEDKYAANYYDMHDETVADTEVYRWMAEHCQEYGFILRYPEGKEDLYVRACYPGHFRYVGQEAAEYIMEHDLCLEEFMALYGRHEG